MRPEELPRTVEEARRLGVRYIWTGVPCRHGHVEIRRVSAIRNSSRCIACDIDSYADWYTRKHHRAAGLPVVERVIAERPRPPANTAIDDKHLPVLLDMVRAGRQDAGKEGWPWSVAPSGSKACRLDDAVATTFDVALPVAREWIAKYEEAGLIVREAWRSPGRINMIVWAVRDATKHGSECNQ